MQLYNLNIEPVRRLYMPKSYSSPQKHHINKPTAPLLKDLLQL